MGSRMPAINNLRPLIAINERDRHQNNITTKQPFVERRVPRIAQNTTMAVISWQE